MRLGCILIVLSLPLRPDPVLTPGQVRDLTMHEVCTTKWGLDARYVSKAKKRHVLEGYGLTWADHTRVVIDHLVPRELAGADEVPNLWPQSKLESKRKDVTERRLHKHVCDGTLSLTAAQAQMRTWGR